MIKSINNIKELINQLYEIGIDEIGLSEYDYDLYLDNIDYNDYAMQVHSHRYLPYGFCIVKEIWKQSNDT